MKPLRFSVKPLRYRILTLLAAIAVLLPSYACGPDFASAIFVLPEAPDGNYAAFVAGHLGVLQPGFHSRSLAVAYLVLSGQRLSPSSQAAAIGADTIFMHPDGPAYDPGYDPSYDPSKLPPPPPGLTRWIAARKQFGPVDGYLPAADLQTTRPTDANQYDTFTNCLDDAFNNATSTLNSRIAQHPQNDPAVTEWVRGQDAVFSNCGDGKAPRYFGPGQPPPPPIAPHSPATLHNPAQWLQQDRAYQLAAAQFYAMHFETAAASFHAIAADKASPWSTTARYVQARAYIRKAAFTPQPQNDGSGAPLTADQHSARQALYQQQLQQAALQRQTDLRHASQILVDDSRDPSMASMRNSIDGLLDYVNARLQPEQQTIALAARLVAPQPQRMQQALVDFTFLHTPADVLFGVGIADPNSPQRLAERHTLLATDQNNPALSKAADLSAWVDAMNDKDAKSALDHWHATHSTPWLVASLILTQSTGPDTAALLTAAKAIPENDPAWLTVTYNRLRLSASTDATRSEITALLPRLRKTEGPSAVNLFTALAAAHAPTLQDWLSHAGRTPAGETDDSDIDTAPYTQPKEDVCGRPFTHTELFDTDAAVALNRQMPLRLLAAAAESSALPENLRFQVAQAALTRAILLDQPAIANRMAPILVACRSAWKPVLDAYAAASTPPDRHAAGLLALMRFASTEPSVREGEERRQGFATYDDLRQNWWCSTVPLPTSTVDDYPLLWRPGADPDAVHGSDPASMTTHPHIAPPPPPFLTPADLAEAQAEVTTLEAIPNASSYLALQAIDWFHTHPTDPRTVDILGEADRVLRNSCRHDPGYGKQPTPDSTATYAHTVFDILHQNFPKSPWALRYKTWE